jgi:hypothetical protein
MRPNRPKTNAHESFWLKLGDRRRLARLYDLWDELDPKRRDDWLAIGRTLVNVEKRKKERERMRSHKKPAALLKASA